MTELNKDGLIPGQEVDFATVQRIERARQPQAKPVEPPAPAKRGRPATVNRNV